MHCITSSHRFLFCPCSQLEKIIVAGYKALNLQYFFTGGPDEVKAWTIQVSGSHVNNRIQHQQSCLDKSIPSNRFVYNSVLIVSI